MGHCTADPSLERLMVGTFAFPLGVYPIEPTEPLPGYAVAFEPADADDSEWEQWPDRYVYDVVVTAEALPSLCRNLLVMMPGRVYPILDFLGQDAFREIDPYLAYEPVGLDRVLEAMRRYRVFLFDDGLCGWGAMSEDPFFYLFIDEHKIMTLRVPAERKDEVDRLLQVHGLRPLEEPKGADAVEHEHRTVLKSPPEDPDSMIAEEVVDALKEDWRLSLNIDPESNLDDDGNALGTTAWRCLVRVGSPGDRDRFIEVYLAAGSLTNAEHMALDAAGTLAGDQNESEDATEPDMTVLASDRITPEQLREALGGQNTLSFSEERIFRSGWVE